MNNSLKAVTPLLTIISSENTSNTGQQNNRTSKIDKQNNHTSNTVQQNNHTSKIDKKNNHTSNTGQQNNHTSKIDQQNNHTQNKSQENTGQQNNRAQKKNKTFSTILKKSNLVINPGIQDNESFQYSVTTR